MKLPKFKKTRDFISKKISSVFNGFSHLREEWLESHRTPVADTDREFQSLVMRRQWSGKWRVDGFVYEPADRQIIALTGEAIPDTYRVQTGKNRVENYFGHLTGNLVKGVVFHEAVALLKQYDAEKSNAAFLKEIDAKPHDRHYTVMMAAYQAREADSKAAAKPKAAKKSNPKT
ncbi:MAG: hypothetical protein EA357_05300 [Micavibrio sp.]|nr:MAG: hypothetical protein EA357_05300 [Micavibrio sp.]